MGVDMLAGALEVLGLWLIGKKMWVGFLANIVGGVIWIYVGITNEIYGLLLVCLSAMVINIKNIKKWRVDE